MQYEASLKKLSEKKLPNAILLAGEEDYLAERFLDRLFSRLLPSGNHSAIAKLSSPSFSELAAACKAISFFEPQNIVMLRQEKCPNDKKLPPLLESLDENTFLIWRTPKLDKRQSLYKNFNKYGLAVDLIAPRPYQAGAWIAQKLREIKKDLSPAAREYLLTALSQLPELPLGFLEQEFEKLRFFVDGPKISRADLIASFSSLPEISGFAYAEAVAAKDAPAALKLLERQRQEGVKVPLIVGILNRQLHSLWQIKALAADGLDNGAIAQKVKLPPFVVQKLAQKARLFSLGELYEGIIDLSEADYAFKTGKASPFFLETLTIKLCRRL